MEIVEFRLEPVEGVDPKLDSISFQPQRIIKFTPLMALSLAMES